MDTENKKAVLPKLRRFSVSIVPLWLNLFALWAVLGSSAIAELAVRQIQVSPSVVASRVPVVTAQGRALAPQAVSAVDISADGKFITVGTMAFSHDANVWLITSEGTVRARRNVPPWAPIQIGALESAGEPLVMAVGLAYSRVTSPEPVVCVDWSRELFGARVTYEMPDSRDGQFARLRYGHGDWQQGWLVSHFGELFVRGTNWVFQPPNFVNFSNGYRSFLRAEDKNLLPTHRAMRMKASADSRHVAFGWVCLGKPVTGLPHEKQLVSVWSLDRGRRPQVNPPKQDAKANPPASTELLLTGLGKPVTSLLWSAPPSADLALPPLPDPAKDFPELVKDGFRLGADALEQGTVATALALNRDGSRVAVVEHGVWTWVRSGPAIGKWDPPIHALNFVPRQRGRLRVFDGNGRELLREWLPEAGLFEVGFGGDADAVWCWPASWFARGMAGEPWLPVERDARTVYHVNLATRATDALALPDAVADCAVNPVDGRALVSCWNGRAYLVNAAGKVSGQWEPGSPARLAWSAEGLFAIAGTSSGVLLRVEPDGKLAWKQSIPARETPAITVPPPEVVAGVPVHQGGRIPQSEHAYVGDIWILKLGREAVVVDAGGTSGFALSQARVRSLGIERVTHVLHTHSHGDHCGGAYLWRAAGAKIVAPKSAALTLTWLMPMLTDYGIFPPRPVDVPLPLARVGDEAEFEAAGVKFRAVFVPGHSFDLTVYLVELGGKRVAFTGDLGFERESDILHRCWGDAAKARAVVKVIREQVLAWRPDVVFTGHGVRPSGTEWVADLVRRTDESLANAAEKAEKK